MAEEETSTGREQDNTAPEPSGPPKLAGEEVAVTTPQKTDKLEKAINFLVTAFFPLLIVASWIAAFATPLIERNQLTIVAYLKQVDANNYELRGRILLKGDPVHPAKVWAIVADARGNRDSPPGAQTDDKGSFVISPVPTKLGEPVTEATVYAKMETLTAERKEPTVLTGEESLVVGVSGIGLQRRVRMSPVVLLPLPVVFFISLLVPFFGKPTLKKYVFAIILAFLLTSSMIVYISLGLRYVSSVGKAGEVLSLGFASIFQGTYVKGVNEEWLFSLTAPQLPAPVATVSSAPSSPAAPSQTPSAKTPSAQTPPAKTPPAQTSPPSQTPTNSPSPAAAITPASNPAGGTADVVRGFGAPLWVVLMSVLGAGLLTVGLIVKEIKERPAPNDEAKIQERLQTMVQHQFFILFAPLGAVFVYQILVVGEAASQPLTVALASLGAGASMNVLLSKAVSYSASLIEGLKQP